MSVKHKEVVQSDNGIESQITSEEQRVLSNLQEVRRKQEDAERRRNECAQIVQSAYNEHGCSPVVGVRISDVSVLPLMEYLRLKGCAEDVQEVVVQIGVTRQ